MSLKKTKKNVGVTLIEAIVLLLILAILGLITVSSISNFVYTSNDESRLRETETIVENAIAEVSTAYEAGKKIGEINGSSKSANNLRIKILRNSGYIGTIVSFHVSNAQNINSKATTPAPHSLNYRSEGTLEFLEYRGSGGWYGQYRILANGTSEIRIIDSPNSVNGVSTGDKKK